jgi:hypothetical protein
LSASLGTGSNAHRTPFPFDGPSTTSIGIFASCRWSKVGEQQNLGIARSLQKKIFGVVKMAVLEKLIKGLALLTEMGVEGAKTRKYKNRVNPTVGFRIRFVMW